MTWLQRAGRIIGRIIGLARVDTGDGMREREAEALERHRLASQRLERAAGELESQANRMAQTGARVQRAFEIADRALRMARARDDRHDRG